MDLQPSNKQKIFVIVVGIVLVVGVLWGVSQFVGGSNNSTRQEACERAADYHAKHPSAAAEMTLDDSICHGS